VGLPTTCFDAAMERPPGAYNSFLFGLVDSAITEAELEAGSPS